MMLRSPSIPSSSQTPLQFPSSLSRSIPTPLLTLPRSYSTTTLRSLAARRSKRVKAIPSESALGGAILGTSAAQPPSAARVVIDFYEGINRRDLGFVEGLIAENCVYEDLVFSTPFVGRKAILEFFEKFTQSISSELRFVIDDISSEDSSAIGVTWHLEWKGKPFPFSKGCSFYRLEILDGKKQIVYGRDCVEPAMKPGEFALVIIRGVTSLLQQFPWLADKL